MFSLVSRLRGLKKAITTTRMMQVSRPYHESEDEICSIFGRLKIDSNSDASLDLGSGPNPKNPFGASSCYGVDIRSNELKKIIYADFANGILPFEDEKFNYVTAYDVLEHIPRVIVADGSSKFPFIQIMNEIFRVLTPGGIFFSIHPVYPAKEAFQDPTHVNIMTEDTIDYYFCEQAWARIYGFEGSFLLLHDGWVNNRFFTFLKKSCDYPIRSRI